MGEVVKAIQDSVGPLTTTVENQEHLLTVLDNQQRGQEAVLEKLLDVKVSAQLKNIKLLITQQLREVNDKNVKDVEVVR